MTEEQQQFILRKMNLHTCPYCGTPIIDTELRFAPNTSIIAIKPCCDKSMDYCNELYAKYYSEMCNRIFPLVGNPRSLNID